MADPVGWRVVVEVDPGAAELVADELFVLGAIGIEEQAAPGGQLRLLAGMPDELSASSGAAQVGGRVEPVVDDSWADAWREWAKPVRVGRVLVQPAWIEVEADPDADHVVTIDPARAFGSGGHETTQLALDVLLEQLPRGARLLDVGCGSGVLAVAAAVARGATVVAIDIDEDAVVVTRENARRNGLSGSVVASSTAVAEIDERFDVVVANILAVTLRELAPDIARVVRPGGVVVLSGMLVEQVDSVDRAYADTGLVGQGERRVGDWCARWYRAGESAHR